MELRILSDKE